MTDHLKTILITGATGAIGDALAKAYAAPKTRLILHGRRRDLLDKLAQHCREQGAVVEIGTTDLRDISALFSWLDEICLSTLPDIVIANAGININIGTDRSGEKWEQVDALLDTNIKATIALLNRLAVVMRERGSGQLVVISSLAAWHGLPQTPSYSASKAALKAYGEALRGWLRRSGVGVTVVMPGYVASKMSDDMPGPKPFMWTSERAAQTIIAGISANKARISFPFPLNFGCWWLAVLPAVMSQKILRWFHYE